MIYNNSSIITLSESAINNNIEFIRRRIGSNVTLSSVVKGNAYGHGIAQMVPTLERAGVRHFSVFSSFEAREVASCCRNDSSVMIMGDIAEEDIPWVVHKKIECFAYNFFMLKRLIKEATEQQAQAVIHIELETGMNRHGFASPEWSKLAALLKEHSQYVKIRGICTHLAGAESVANYKRVGDQQSIFQEGVAFFRSEGINPDMLHTSCSAATIAYPQWNYDMVRVGIMTYGLWPSTEMEIMYKLQNNTQSSPLLPVLSWRSHIIDISEVESGQFVGYGTSYLAETNIKVASVPVGYAYGFKRNLSNTGRVIVKGTRLSVIGMVNMNMFLIDATNVEVNIGDTVTIIGKDGNQSINVAHFGNLSDQLNYELLTRLDKDIKRVLVE